MLTAGDEAGVIFKGTIRRRHALVVLFDPGFHLGEESGLQLLDVGHLVLRIGILGLEMGADRGIENGRVTHHLLPVRGAQPGVIVLADDAMMSVGEGTARGAGRPAGRRDFWIHARSVAATLVFGIELQRTTIDAIALAGGFRSVSEDVAEMRLTIGAADLRPAHQEFAILVLAQGAVVCRCIEARPARAGIVFGIGAEQRRAASDAFVHAVALLLPARMAEGTLGAMLAGDVILLESQLFRPLSIGLGKLHGVVLLGLGRSVHVWRLPVLKDGGYPQYGDRQKATPGRETVCHGALMAC